MGMMRGRGWRHINEIGNRYGRYVVIGEAQRSAAGAARFLCRCDCGEERIVQGSRLRAARAKSCGCYMRDANRMRMRKHGGYRTPEHASWEAMHTRCRNPDAKNGAYHAARGIKVCERWGDFGAFRDDMGPRPSRRHSIERIDNDRDYEHGNCRWALPAEQMRNTRQNSWLEFDGARLPFHDMAALYRIEPMTLKWRLDNGWPLDRALTQEVRHA